MFRLLPCASANEPPPKTTSSAVMSAAWSVNFRMKPPLPLGLAVLRTYGNRRRPVLGDERSAREVLVQHGLDARHARTALQPLDHTAIAHEHERRRLVDS